MTQTPLNFVASMTVCPSDIHKIQRHVELAQPRIDPLENVLVTPMFSNEDTLALIKNFAEQGKKVYFDSGGYYVQIGKMKYTELYSPLLEIYRSNPWASVYTLPDHVPVSSDDEQTIEWKIRDTIDFSTLFYQELPDELKPKAMPVVQGHTWDQIDRCLEAYIKLGVKWIGFGSFGTMGQNNEVNVATANSIELAEYVIRVAHQHGARVHLFGIGAPALVAMHKGIQADSFDTAAWLKAAGYGMVSLPLMRYWNITYQNNTSTIQRGIPVEEFYELRNKTKHHCKLCEDLELLQNSKMYRAVHNLIVIAESVAMVNGKNSDLVQNIYQNGSPKYKLEYEKWLQLI
jgi:hypothetical protein